MPINLINQTSDYNEDNAEILSKMAAIGEENSRITLESMINDLSASVMSEVCDPLQFSVIFDRSGTWVISYRGTKNFSNLITDIQLDFIPFPHIPGARVHRGFKTAADALWPRLFSMVVSSNCSSVMGSSYSTKLRQDHTDTSHEVCSRGDDGRCAPENLDGIHYQREEYICNYVNQEDHQYAF